jgi:hypothetical protein
MKSLMVSLPREMATGEKYFLMMKISISILKGIQIMKKHLFKKIY